MKKISLICPKCEKRLLKVLACKDLTLSCECGEDILLNAEIDQIVIKMRGRRKSDETPKAEAK